MNFEIFAEKKDRSGIEKLLAKGCKCGGTPLLRTEQLPSNKMYWFKCERCGKHTGWHSMIQDTVEDWNENPPLQEE